MTLTEQIGVSTPLDSAKLDSYGKTAAEETTT